MRHLIDRPCINLNELLIYAIEDEKMDIAKTLLAAGANPNYEEGRALNAAASLGSTEMIDLLFDHGFRATERNLQGRYRYDSKDPLEVTASKGHAEATKLLLQAGFKSASALYAAVKANLPEIVRLLIEHDATIDFATVGGKSLREAACHSYVQIARLLIKHGAPVNSIDGDGRTPMHWAILGLNKQQSPYIFIWDCPGTGSMDMLQVLIEGAADVNLVDKQKRRPLHLALQESTERVVRFLVDKGADVNARTARGWTSLHYLFNRRDLGTLSILKALLNAGADPKLAGVKPDRSWLDSAMCATPPEQRQEFVSLIGTVFDIQLNDCGMFEGSGCRVSRPVGAGCPSR